MIEPGVALSTLAYSGVAGFGLGTAFLFVRWAAQFIAGRIDHREEQADQRAARVDAGTQLLIAQLQDQVRGLLAHKETVEKKLAECMERDIEKERRIAQLEGLTAGLGDARQHAQLIVSSEKKSEKKE